MAQIRALGSFVLTNKLCLSSLGRYHVTRSDTSSFSLSLSSVHVCFVHSLSLVSRIRCFDMCTCTCWFTATCFSLFSFCSFLSSQAFRQLSENYISLFTGPALALWHALCPTTISLRLDLCRLFVLFYFLSWLPLFASIFSNQTRKHSNSFFLYLRFRSKTKSNFSSWSRWKYVLVSSSTRPLHSTICLFASDA